MTAKVFVDASFYIALANERDQHHGWAVERAIYLENEKRHLVITRAVLLEIDDALSKPRFRREAAALLQFLEDDPTVEIIPLSVQLYQRALKLFRQRPDKAWSLTDCISFTVMNDLDISTAVTTDHHFRQAGFTSLLADR